MPLRPRRISVHALFHRYTSGMKISFATGRTDRFIDSMEIHAAAPQNRTVFPYRLTAGERFVSFHASSPVICTRAPSSWGILRCDMST